LCFILLGWMPFTLVAQQQLTLAECYHLARLQSPLSGQLDLLDEQHELDIEAINTAHLPQFELGAKATYQSDVTYLPVEIPMMSIDPVSKDQYAATATVNQSVYDGGVTRATADVQEAMYRVSGQQVEVRLYQLYLRVNRYFFSALLAQAGIQDLQSKRDLLEARQSEVRSAVTHGLLEKSAGKSIEVELLQVDQALVEAERRRENALASLFALTGIDDEESESTILSGVADTTSTDAASRPEIGLYTLRQEMIDAQAASVQSFNQPKVAVFATGGYGQPGLNMLEDAFRPYFIAGVKLAWTPFNWNATRKRTESLQLERALVDRERADFERDVGIEMRRLQSEMASLRHQLATDEEIIALREEVLAARTSQLRNGAITPSDYLAELTDLFEARNAMSTRRVQLQHTMADYRIIKGL
jgi:outer membrane protein TolC